MKTSDEPHSAAKRVAPKYAPGGGANVQEIVDVVSYPKPFQPARLAATVIVARRTMALRRTNRLTVTLGVGHAIGEHARVALQMVAWQVGHRSRDDRRIRNSTNSRRYRRGGVPR